MVFWWKFVLVNFKTFWNGRIFFLRHVEFNDLFFLSFLSSIVEFAKRSNKFCKLWKKKFRFFFFLQTFQEKAFKIVQGRDKQVSSLTFAETSLKEHFDQKKKDIFAEFWYLMKLILKQFTQCEFKFRTKFGFHVSSSI